MAKDRMDVLELLREEMPDADLDLLCEGLWVLMEAEVTTKTEAGLGERSPVAHPGQGSWSNNPQERLNRRYGGAPTSWASSPTGLRSRGSSPRSSPSSTTSGRSPAAICALLSSTSAISTTWRHQ